MFPLTTAEKIFARLSVAFDASVEAALYSALEGAYTHLEAALETQLARNDHEDLFFIDKGTYAPYSKLYRLKLTNGFVVPGSVTVSLGESIFASSWEDGASGQFLLVADKGFVDVPDEYANKAIRINYESGFEYDANDLEATYAVIPAWLQEAAMAQAIKILSIQQMGDEKPVLVKLYKMLDEHRLFLTDRKLRHSSRAIPAANK